MISNVQAQFDPLAGQGGPGQNPGGFLAGVGEGVGGADQLGGNNPQGGGSMADFGSLMMLLQQTIEPTSWEALGGVGTMAPYPQGVMVDPQGLVRDQESMPSGRTNNAAAIAKMLAAPGDTERNAKQHAFDDWRTPARVRCVSIRRMMQALAGRSLNQSSLTTVTTGGPESKTIPTAKPADSKTDEELAAFAAMAGLSRITLVLVTHDDLILAGPVAGFDEIDGWQIDRASGLPPMSLISFAVGLQSARSGVPFGCTIDPTTQGLQSAAALGQRIVSGDIPMARAADELAASLGRQDIIVFGTTPSNEVAYLMVEADRHMKRLALGDEPMPDRVRNYLQLIPTIGDGTPPTDLLLRLWFTSNAINIRAAEVDAKITTASPTDASPTSPDKIIQLAGKPIRLSGDNERAKLDGARGNHVIDDVSIAFVDHFNQNWAGIRAKYPVYGALESLYLSTAIAEIWRRTASTPDHEVLQRATLFFAAQRAEKLNAPTQVDSIAAMHRYRQGRKQHHVLMASGGVEISAQELLPLKMRDYPALGSYANLRDQRPTDRWWWNGGEGQ